MNLSRNWLSDFVDTNDITNQDFCDRMTITGSKVEGFEVLGDDIENVVVARVTKMEKHPDSDQSRKTTRNADKAIPTLRSPT